MTYTDHDRWLYIQYRSLPATLDTFYTIMHMSTKYTKNTRSCTMTQTGHDRRLYNQYRSSSISNIQYTPQGRKGLCPLVRIIRTCVYFTESYYDKHTNTTEICPDYYIYPLERSIRLIISIMIDIRLVSRCVLQIYNSTQFNYEQYFIPYSLYVCLDQAPTLKCLKETRSPDGDTSISRAPCMRRQDYHK